MIFENPPSLFENAKRALLVLSDRFHPFTPLCGLCFGGMLVRALHGSPFVIAIVAQEAESPVYFSIPVACVQGERLVLIYTLLSYVLYGFVILTDGLVISSTRVSNGKRSDASIVIGKLNTQL